MSSVKKYDIPAPTHVEMIALALENIASAAIDGYPILSVNRWLGRVLADIRALHDRQAVEYAGLQEVTDSVTRAAGMSFRATAADPAISIRIRTQMSKVLEKAATSLRDISAEGGQ